MYRITPLACAAVAIGMLAGTACERVPAANEEARTGMQQTPATFEQRARTLMAEVPLIDGHNDIAWELRQKAGYDFDKWDLRKPQPFHTDIPRLRRGAVGGQFWSVYVPASLRGGAAVTATLEQIAAVREMARRYPETFELATTADDIERIFKAGRIASLIGMEGGHSIDASLAALRMFRALGAAYMTLTHSEHLPWADSSAGAPLAGGLTRFGEEVVREMNWLGMLVDLSHVSPDTMNDAMRVSEAPVIFSHSSARALCDVYRNVPDEVLRRLPDDGGVIMITFVPDFVAPAGAEYNRRLQAETDRLRAETPDISPAALEQQVTAWRSANPRPIATLSMVADHIDHARTVAGIDHIGIGSDFDGVTRTPQGLEDVSTFPALIAELLRRGYSDDDVRKLLGLNVLRVLRRAEQVAARLQASRPPSVATIEQLDGTTGARPSRQ